MTAVAADVHRAPRGTSTLKQSYFVQSRVMRSANYYIKHYASIMPDATFDVEVDDHLRRIVVLARPFDSFLFAELITRVIPDDLGIIAFPDSKRN